MEYKILSPLKTRMVLPWETYVKDNNVFEMGALAQSAAAVKQAVDCGWFDGDQPDVDEMSPADVVQLSTRVIRAYSAAMGFDKKKITLGAADYADGVTDTPPEELKIALQCRTWGCLPSELAEQPFGLLDRMTLALNVFDACRAAQGERMSPETARIFAWVQELRFNAD